MFVPLVFTDDASRACRNQQIIDGLGSIKLELYKGEMAQEAVPVVQYDPGLTDQSPIHSGMMTELDMTERAA